MADEIHIEELELESRIGVTAEERAQAQRLTVSVTIEPAGSFRELQDRIDQTVDYAAVCAGIKQLAATGERNLIETLAEEIAAMLLREFRVRAVSVELRKYILPDTKFVAARISRSG